MQLQRATPIVGTRRPRVIARLVIASITSITSIVALHGVAAQASADPARARPCAAVTTMLTKASAGLLMPSESDSPFTTFTWTGAARRPLTTARLLELTGHTPDTVVEVVDLQHFFRNMAYRQPWHDRQQARDVRKFERLLRVIERHLTDVQVYRVGTVRIDAYLVGRCGNDLTGLQTVLIET
ncbi:MAG: nuclease A inhibitor family protein [Actinomycetes bacterium]